MQLKWLRRLPLAALLMAAPLHAYVTSAVLEFSADDKAGFFLNGSPILKKSDFCPNFFECLSTSDGTLPMELFDPDHDNLLAIEDYDVEGGHMCISYRFTVHISDGDPIVIWSDPSPSTKFLHLAKEQPDPEGWTERNFDDSSWQPAVAASELKFPFYAYQSLPDSAFGTFLGGGVVPHLSHQFSMLCNTADHNLFRAHFKFPNHQGKITAVVNPATGVKGQKLSVQLFPGPDSAEFSQFNTLAWLPQGLEPVGVSPGYKWAPNLRRLSWSFNRSDLKVGYSHMYAQRVVSAGGWSAPEKVLGPFKAGKGRRKLNTPSAIWDDGARFTSHNAGWFKLAPHGVDLSQGRPKILGVIFRSQMRLGGRDTQTQTEADAVLFNYSVDGSTRGALKDDVEVSRMSNDDNWFDGYYDATEDRPWTWEDLDNLSVKYEAIARGTVDQNLPAGVQAIVKYYTPKAAAPYFYALVTEPKCTHLTINSALFRIGSAGAVPADPVDVPVNQALCAPTPVPTATETPVPIAVMVIPTPQPTNMPTAGIESGLNQFHIENLAASPEPFNYAGTFISFNVKKDVDVTINVYSAETGHVVRQIKAGSFRAGDNNQVFFNAKDTEGHTLSPGAYTFELVAEKNGHKEQRNAVFHAVRKGH